MSVTADTRNRRQRSTLLTVTSGRRANVLLREATSDNQPRPRRSATPTWPQQQDSNLLGGVRRRGRPTDSLLAGAVNVHPWHGSSRVAARPARPSSHFQTLQACRGPPRPSTPFLSASSPAVPPSAGPGRTRPRTLQHASPPSGTRRTLSLRSRLALHTACVQPVVATRLSVPLAFLGANTHTTPTQANTTLTPGARVTADSDPNTGSC